MTDEEKQIEEMANAIFDYVDTQKKDHVYICNNKASELAKPFLHNTAVAEFMYKRGYRRQSDTVREVLQKVIAQRDMLRLEGGLDGIKEIVGISMEKLKKIAEEYGVKLEDLCD